MAEPALKKQKTEDEEDAPMAEEAAPVDQAPKEPEPPKELEVDAPLSKKPRTKEVAAFLVPDTTLNVVQSTLGNVLMCLAEGGIQHLYAGARASVGITKGRYAFEVKIVSVVNTAEAVQPVNNRSLNPRNVVRIGLSTAGSELVLGETEDSICFESEGVSIHNKKRSPGVERFVGGNLLTVILNLDEKSANFNTVSFFKDGVRAAQPVQLPESMRGKPLFPHVSFKGVSLHANFGPHQLAPLPFTCRMLGDACEADVVATKFQAPADGKHSVVFPISMPDEGTFDWLDQFLDKNPQYTELSDRKILQWAERSGIHWLKNATPKHSNDKPAMAFNCRELDDYSMQRAVWAIAPLQQRNYVVMEVRSNLLKEERAELLAKFNTSTFRRTAYIIMGEPNHEFKRRTQTLLLKDKQEAADKEHERQEIQKKRKKELERKQAEMLKARRQVERDTKKQRKAAEAEAMKKAEQAAAKAKAEAEGEKKEGEEEKKEEGVKEEAKAEKKEVEVSSDEESEVEEVKEEVSEAPPKVELTAEEKKMLYRKFDVKDLSVQSLGSSFTKFSLPEKEEGFDDVKYEWSKTSTKCKDYVAAWVLDRKVTTRIEDIVPSEWFHENWKEWQTVFQTWLTKLNEWKAEAAKKAADKTERQARAAKRKVEAAMAKSEAEVEKDGDGDAKKEEEKDKEKDKDGENAEPTAEQDLEQEKKEEAAELAFEGVDVFGLENIMDAGDGMPVFRHFLHEDWTMTALRFELHLLAHAVLKDAGDPERPGIHADHVAFYYQKYYKRTLQFKEYGVDTFQDLAKLIDDTIFITERGVVEPLIRGDLETPQVFSKLAEEARRYRALRIDMGEENARLKLSTASQWQGNAKRQPGNWQANQGKQGGGCAKGCKGGKGQQWPQPGFKGGVPGQMVMHAPQQQITPVAPQGGNQWQPGGQAQGSGGPIHPPGGPAGAWQQGGQQGQGGNQFPGGGQWQPGGNQNQFPGCGGGGGQWQGGNQSKGGNQWQHGGQSQGGDQFQGGNGQITPLQGSEQYQGGNQFEGGNQQQGNQFQGGGSQEQGGKGGSQGWQPFIKGCKGGKWAPDWQQDRAPAGGNGAWKGNKW